MADKKFKPTKKQGIYAAAGAALVGTMAAAAITAPNIINNTFDAGKYSFNDTRKNGNVAYNTAESAGRGSGNSQDGLNGSNDSDKSNDEKQEEMSEADSPKQQENVQRPKDEQNENPKDAKRDSSYNNKGSSQEESTGIGRDENGYALINSNLTTDVAASRDSLADKLNTDPEKLVDMIRENMPEIKPTVAPTAAPTAVPRATAAPTRVPATAEPLRTPNPTSKERATAAPVRTTEDPLRGAITSPIPGNSVKTVTSPAPEASNEPATSAPATPPPATEALEPTAQATAAPTRAPIPTAEPEKSQQDAIKDAQNSGNELSVTKGEVGLTNRRSGSGSSVSTGGATRIDFTTFTGDQSDVEYIQIASTVRTINFETAKTLFPNLKGFVVNENNKYYQSIDGVLYSKDGKILYACPAQLEAIENYPENLETIYDGAFLGSQMKELSLPDTVTSVGKNAFSEAAMGEITFNSSDLTLGEKAFYNSDDNGLSAKKLVFKAADPPEVTDNNALMFKNPHTGLDTSGMVIEVPDTEGDKALQDYIKAWGETIDGIYGSGMTSYLFNTASGAGKNYSFENNSLYHKLSSGSDAEATAAPEGTDSPEAAEPTAAPESTVGDGGYELLYVAPSTEGEYTPLYDTKTIASGAFKGCSGITSLNIPSTVEKLEDGCFEGLKGLTSIVVSGNVPAEIGDDVWSDIDPNEVSIYVYPDSRDSYIESWGKAIDDALGEGTAEKIIKAAAESYTYIDGALYAVHEDGNTLVDAPHTDLDNFKVDESATEIAAGAFGSKYKYAYVLIPDSVKTIDKDAFKSTRIDTLVMTVQEPPELPEDIDVSGIETLYVPSGSVDQYKEKWGNKFSDIQAPSANYASQSHAIYGVNEDGTYELLNVPVVYSGNFTMLDMVREIRERAMADAVDVTGIDFSVITEKIGKEAFINNTALKSVDMSRMTSLKEIPERVFYNNSAMTDMQLPELLEVIGDYMAAENTSLETVNFNKLSKLKSIGSHAFYNDKSLKQISLSSSSSLTEIGDSAFENAESLTTVRLPINLTQLSDRLFKNASSLTRVSFPSTLKSIGDETFYGTAIETVNFTYFDDLESIGEGAFANNTVLTTYKMPDKVTKISARTAEGDTSLALVSLSPDTTEIGDAAFKDCISLEEIDIPAAIQKIGSQVFDGCDKLSKVIVRAKEPAQLGEDAFGSKLAALQIYVPDDSYDSYVTAWDEGLYNKAAQIIQKLSSIGGEEPERTPVPTEVPVQTVKPIVPTLPPITPGGTGATAEPSATEAPNATAEPGATAEPDTTDAPGTTAEPDATDAPDTTAEPGATAEPDATDAPGTTAEPNAAAEPDETNAPGATDAPSEGSELTETASVSKTEASAEAKSVSETEKEEAPSPAPAPEESKKQPEEAEPAPAIAPKQDETE